MNDQEISERGTVLLVDDEDYVRESLAELLTARGFHVRQARSGEEVLAPGGVDGLDVVVTDLRMPGISGEEVVKGLALRDTGLPILVLTAHGTVSSAVACLQAGAIDYLLKPVDIEELELTIDRATEEAARDRELRFLRDRAGEGPRRLLGESPAWQQVLATLAQVAPSDSPVLLVGESGTGKEELARRLHLDSARSRHAFVAVNCAAIPGELFESELFGHRRGAFTGAVADREGRFRVAHRGTLFLDEINSLPITAQAKLLRVLQDGAFERVGDSRPTRVDVRLVCAANVDLERAVEEGNFRPDLLYRINVITLPLPPLRERSGDIPLLVESFVAEIAARLGRRAPGVPSETLEALEQATWPGNVRELRNVVERAILLCQGDTLTLDLLPFDPLDGSRGSGSARESGGGEPPLGEEGIGKQGLEEFNLRQNLRAAERQALLAALRRGEGVRREAARLLGIDERNLAYHLRKHDLMDWTPEADN